MSLPGLLSIGTDDSLMQNVFSNQTTEEVALDAENLEVSIANLDSAFDAHIADSSSSIAKLVLQRLVLSHSSFLNLCLSEMLHTFFSVISGATHADVKITEEEDFLRATITVYYHYLELEPIGEMIDGDLVVQGLSIRDNYGPAFCTLEYAKNMGDPYTEIGVVAPWSFMLTPSEGDQASGDVAHKAAQFVIPVSVDTEYRDGIIRVQIYVDQADKIPYDEEPIGEDGECTFDMKSAARRALMICAVSIIKQSTATTKAHAGDGDGDLSNGVSTPAVEATTEGEGERTPPTGRGGSEPGVASRRGSDKSHASQRAAQAHEDGAVRSDKGDAENEELAAILGGAKLEDVDTDDASPVAGAMNSKFGSRSNTPMHAQQSPDIAAETLLLEQAQGVITDIRIASDYDDVVALQAEGYELNCTHVTADGVVSEQEHLWRFHVMATYGTYNISFFEQQVIFLPLANCIYEKSSCNNIF